MLSIVRAEYCWRRHTLRPFDEFYYRYRLVIFCVVFSFFSLFVYIKNTPFVFVSPARVIQRTGFFFSSSNNNIVVVTTNRQRGGKRRFALLFIAGRRKYRVENKSSRRPVVEIFLPDNLYRNKRVGRT